jgi:aspartate/methionine/tyrosine aminotransferase
MKIISICKLILIAASTVTSINSISKELDPTVCGTRVGWFINGVQNSSDEARLNAKKLEDILAASKSTQDIQVKLAYNPTNGALDFFDVFNQKRREWSALTFKQLVEYYLFYQVPSWAGTGERSRFEQSMRDALANTQCNVFRYADFDGIV